MIFRLFVLTGILFVLVGPVFSENPVISNVDKAILQQKLEKFSKERSNPMGELILKIGMDFINTPYVAKTLDKTKEELLVINLHQLDCTTFAENCLALARTIKSGDPDADRFCSELENLRYRSGKLAGYSSRLHYFSEWILDNDSRHNVEAITAQLGGIALPIHLNFMSTHPSEYPQLVNDPESTLKIKLIEEKVSAQKFWFIPADQFESVEKSVKNGDIVTLTTSIPGIDVSHVGILFRKNERIYLLHASSSAQKVVVSDEPFSQYLKKSKKTTGIMVARPGENTGN
jgi:hypothetical protein